MERVAPSRRTLTILILLSLALLVSSYFVQTMTLTRLNLLKISQLIRLFSAVLALTAAVLYVTATSAVEWIRRNSFGITIAAASTLLMIGYRFLIHAGIAFYPASGDTISSGFLYYPEDNFSYAAWAAQAAKGALLFQNPYTLQQHSAVYFNPFFLATGYAARLFHVPVIPVLILTGILASMVGILSVHSICRKMELKEPAARWGTLLAAFSSGISVPAYYLGLWLGIPISAGSDLRYMDSILFSTSYALPYQSFTYALQALVILLVVRIERNVSKNFHFLLLGFLQLFAVFARPYEWLLLLSGYATYIALSRNRTRKQVLIAIVLLLATMPGVIYNWWLSHQPVWQDFAKITIGQQKFRLYWLVGYGLITPLAIAGSIAIWKSRQVTSARWIAAAACIAIFLLMVLNIKEVKFASCAPLFLCISAGVGIHTILQRIEEVKSAAIKLLVRLGLIPAFILLFGTSLFLLLAYFHSNTFDRELIWIARDLPPHALLLCDSEDGNILPAIVPTHVYAGHWALTPGYREAKQKLIASGIEAGTTANRMALNKLLTTQQFDLMLIHKNRPAYEWIRSSKEVKLLRCYEKRCLFAVRPENDASRLYKETIKENPDSESAKTQDFLDQKGYKIPDEWMSSRFLTLGDESRKSELILFYMEPVASTGHRLAEFYQGEKPTELWENISKDLDTRSRSAFRILRRN
jgi:hypothetical protein